MTPRVNPTVYLFFVCLLCVSVTVRWHGQYHNKPQHSQFADCREQVCHRSHAGLSGSVLQLLVWDHAASEWEPHGDRSFNGRESNPKYFQRVTVFLLEPSRTQNRAFYRPWVCFLSLVSSISSVWFSLVPLPGGQGTWRATNLEWYVSLFRLPSITFDNGNATKKLNCTA